MPPAVAARLLPSSSRPTSPASSTRPRSAGWCSGWTPRRRRGGVRRPRGPARSRRRPCTRRRPTGVELSVGIVRDPQLGPMVVVAAGGVLVELLGDRAVALPPLSRDRARAMLDRLRVRPLLDGWRGAPAADIDGRRRPGRRGSGELAAGPATDRRARAEPGRRRARRRGRPRVALDVLDDHDRGGARVHGLSDRDLEIQRDAAEFVDTLIPFEVEAELAGGMLPAELVKAHHEEALARGLYATNMPASSGGPGFTALQQVLVQEQVGRVTNGLAWCMHTPPQWWAEAATEEQRERWLLPAVRGERHECYAITEEFAGSDVSALEATARPRRRRVRRQRHQVARDVVQRRRLLLRTGGADRRPERRRARAARGRPADRGHRGGPNPGVLAPHPRPPPDRRRSPTYGSRRRS